MKNERKINNMTKGQFLKAKKIIEDVRLLTDELTGITASESVPPDERFKVALEIYKLVLNDEK